MPKLTRPFDQGQPGTIYAYCYPEPKTGYRVAQDLNLAQNVPYQVKTRHPDLFQETDQGLLSKTKPLMEEIDNITGSKEAELTPPGRDKIQNFLDEDWRNAYGKVLETDISSRAIDIGPYRLLMELIGIQNAWNSFYQERIKELANGEATAKKTDIGFNNSTGIFPIIAEPLYGEEKAETIGLLVKKVGELPNPTLDKLVRIPEANRAKNVAEKELSKSKNLVQTLMEPLN